MIVVQAPGAGSQPSKEGTWQTDVAQYVDRAQKSRCAEQEDDINQPDESNVKRNRGWWGP